MNWLPHFRYHLFMRGCWFSIRECAELSNGAFRYKQFWLRLLWWSHNCSLCTMYVSNGSTIDDSKMHFFLLAIASPHFNFHAEVLSKKNFPWRGGFEILFSLSNPINKKGLKFFLEKAHLHLFFFWRRPFHFFFPGGIISKLLVSWKTAIKIFFLDFLRSWSLMVVP